MPAAGVFSLRALLEVVFRRKSTLLIPLVLVPVLTIGLSYLLPEQYMSTTTILINRSGILNPLVRFETAVSLQNWDELGTLRKIIYSRPLIERVIRELDLEPETTSRRQHEWLIDDIRGSIHILSQQADSFEIGCSAPDPGTAQQLAEKVSEFFIERTLEGSRREANAAVEFIQNQLDAYEQQLAAAKEELKEFTLAHLDEIEQTRAIQGDLSRYEKEVLTTKMDLREARFKAELLDKRLSEEAPMVVAETLYSEDTPYQRRYRELRLERAKLLASRSKDHPEVQKLMREMKIIVKLLEEEKEGGRAQQKREIQSPVYQKTQAKMQEEEILIATLQHELKDYQEKVQQLRKQRAEIPDIQNRYDRLKNDVNNLQETTDSLSTKLQQARISRAVEMEQQKSRFTIINPPLIPFSRYTPIRKTFAIAGVAAGIMLGFALTVGLEIFDPRLCRLNEIERTTALPLWGALPHLHRPPKTRWLRRIPGISLLLRTYGFLFGRRTVYLPTRETTPMELATTTSDSDRMKTVSVAQTMASAPAIQAIRDTAARLQTAKARIQHPLIAAVTSARRLEGKTTITMNLAAMLATESGGEVLIVDGDASSPTLTQHFSPADTQKGNDAHSENDMPQNAIRHTDHPGLHLLPAIEETAELTQRAGTRELHTLLDRMRERYDYILIDLPPVLQFPECRQICEQSDLNLLVTRLYRSPKNVVAAAASSLPDTTRNAVVVNGREFWLPDWLLRWI